jgi:ribose transport system substrate-binding protein
MRRFALLAVLPLLVALVGCPQQPPITPAAPTTGPAPAPTGAAAGKKYTIGMSQCNLGEPWRVQMNADIKEAADKHPELAVIWKDAQNKTEQQQAQVREFISQGVDLIIISPKEAVPLTAPVAEAMEKHIPVIVLDRKIQGDNYTCFIGGDNQLIGQEAGKEMVKLLGGKGNVVELAGLKTSTPADERAKGFREGIKGSQIKILASADCQWLEPNAQREMNSMLAKYDNIDAVYGHNDPSAHGAYLAAQQEGKGREKKIKFVGIDGLPHEGVKYVEDGILSATFRYPTGGQEAIDNALKILQGQTVPKNIVLGTVLFTPENVKAGGEVIAAPGAGK